MWTLTTFVTGMDPAGHCTKSLTPLDPWRVVRLSTEFFTCRDGVTVGQTIVSCGLPSSPSAPAAPPDLDTLVGEWDNPTVIVTLDAKRRLTVPAGLAPASPGDYFDASFDAEEDALVFRRLPAKENWLTVLKACPVSPDDVPRRRRAPARRRKL